MITQEIPPLLAVAAPTLKNLTEVWVGILTIYFNLKMYPVHSMPFFFDNFSDFWDLGGGGKFREQSVDFFIFLTGEKGASKTTKSNLHSPGRASHQANGAKMIIKRTHKN